MWTAFAAAFALQLPAVLWTHHVQPEPYMDEQFHYHQACEIASNPVHPAWDPKITTPSGLYYVSLLMTVGHCSLLALRLTSLCFNALSFALLVEIATGGGGYNRNNSWMLAVRVMSFPPLIFFSQLYYTDAGGVFFVLLGWHMAHKQHLAASLLSLSCAIWFRQTNIVWMLAVGGMRFMEDATASQVFEWAFWRRAVPQYAGYVMIPLAYLFVQVRSTGGSSSTTLVHGDAANHQLSLHLAQLCYLAVALQSGTWEMARMWQRRRRWPLLVVVVVACLVVCFLCVHYGTITHPFLLADNRHFSFYVWQRFFNRSWMAKYALVPVYAACTANVALLVVQSTPNWRVAVVFAVACALSIVPLPLFEPRYLLVPYVLFAVITKSSRRKSIGGEDELMVAAVHGNVASTVQYVFWCWTFQYADGTVGRFMW